MDFTVLKQHLDEYYFPKR